MARNDLLDQRRIGTRRRPQLRNTAPKDAQEAGVRVFLQKDTNDVDNADGERPLPIRQMARAVAFMNHHYQFVFGLGVHSN